MYTALRTRFSPWRLGALGLLAAAAVLIVAQRATQASAVPPGNKANAPRMQELAESDFAVVREAPLELTLPLTGTLVPLNQATVRAKVAGEVVASMAEEGSAVKKGQVLLRLDTRDLHARLVSQQAAYDSAASRLELALRNQANSRALVSQRFISQSAFDAAENAIEGARAAVKAAASERDIASRALDDAAVRAPFDGVISKRLLQLGEKAAPDTALFALVASARMVLEAPVPAAVVARVRVGQVVHFETEGFDGRRFAGKVERINPAAEGGSRMLTVYVGVDNADGALRAGMFAKGAILLSRSAAHPVVPLGALRREGGADLVYKIDGGAIVAQPVQLGLRNEGAGTVAVLSGLRAGERIMVLPLDAIKPGTPVSLPAKG